MARLQASLEEGRASKAGTGDKKRVAKTRKSGTTRSRQKKTA